MIHCNKLIPGVIHYFEFQQDPVGTSSEMILEVVTAGKKLPFSHVSQLTGKFMPLLSPTAESYFALYFFKFVGHDP